MSGEKFAFESSGIAQLLSMVRERYLEPRFLTRIELIKAEEVRSCVITWELQTDHIAAIDSAKEF